MEPEIRPRNLIPLQQDVHITVETPAVHFSQISSSGSQMTINRCESLYSAAIKGTAPKFYIK